MAEALSLAAEPEQYNEHVPVYAYASDDVSLKVLQAVGTESGQSLDNVRRGNLENACEQSVSGILIDFAILDIDEVVEPADLIHMFAEEAEVAYGIIAIGSKNDVRFYHEMVQAGAIDYIVKPLTKKAIDAAMMAAEHRVEQQRKIEAMSAASQSTSEPAPLTIFIAARGGVGCSTAAINAGWCMAHELGKRTVLVDLDLQFGISALALDLDPGRGFREILGHPDRMDSLLLNSALIKEDENFAILGAEEPVEDQIHFEPASIDALMKELGSGFDQILVDLPRGLIGAYRPLVEKADKIVLVTDLTLAGIRDTVRILHMLENAGKKDVVTLVASRLGSDRKAQVGKPQFEKGVKHKINLIVPEDFKNISASANAGRSVLAMAKTSPSAKALRELAKSIVGERKGRKGLFSLFSRKDKKKADAPLGGEETVREKSRKKSKKDKGEAQLETDDLTATQPLEVKKAS